MRLFLLDLNLASLIEIPPPVVLHIFRQPDIFRQARIADSLGGNQTEREFTGPHGQSVVFLVINGRADANFGRCLVERQADDQRGV